MSDTLMCTVEQLRVLAIQISHPSGKISVRSLYQQVIVITHQAIRVTHPIDAFADISKQPKKRFPIIIRFVDVFAAVTA